jgi:predicted CoA-substrate-specific enzyme activase
MNWYVGMDIGAVSVTAAVLCTDKDANLPGPANGLEEIAAAPIAGGRVWISEYRRTRGQPVLAGAKMLQDILAAIGSASLDGLCLTGGGAAVLAERIGAATVNEFKAIASGLAASGVRATTVFEMGGETSKYLYLSAGEDGSYGIVDYSTNGDCAAGTGSFIDQQAGRLQYAVEDIGEICLSAERAAQVAGRCSVFAKSDMIHAQQKGYNPAEVLRGLCNAVARNFRTAVVRSHHIEQPVVFLGGLAANRAVVQSLREAFELDESQLFIPPAHAHVPAIGAAHVASQSPEAVDLAVLAELTGAGESGPSKFPTAAPLTMDNVVPLRDQVVPFEMPFGVERIDAYLGVDIGSVSTNVVVIDADGRMVAEIYTRTMGRPIEVVTDALRQIETEWGDKLNIRGAGTTGSGRELIGALIGADTINDEITCHKTGATYVGQRMLDGRVPDTIFEIGGQDSKYISLQDGIVVDFTMNEACAAGTGSFLEERAEELGIAIKGEFAELALSSRAPVRLGERCTVFMERDVNSYMQRGAEKADLVAGLAYSVVYNYINRVVRGRKIGDCIFFQGGTAYNDSVAAAFAAVCGKEIIVPPHNGVIGAIGAAMLARDKMMFGQAQPAATAGATTEPDSAGGNGDGKKIGQYIPQPDTDNAGEPGKAPSRFRGYDLSVVDYTLREFTCKGCSNTCQIQEFNVEGDKTYWGDKCSEKFRKQSKSARKPVIDNLIAYRTELLLDETALPAAAGGAETVGIPLTMFSYSLLPFWRTAIAKLGYRTILSDPTNKRVVQDGLDSVVAEPCFPIIAAHGHVANLEAKGVDHILMPNIVSMETRYMQTESHLCPWHQTLPFVIRRAPRLGHLAPRFWTPTVHFREGRSHVARQLAAFFKPLGHRRRAVADAVAAGYAAQDAFDTKIRAAGDKALATITATGEPAIVMVGRPYNLHDPGMNLSVGQKLRDYYGVNVIPQDFLPLDEHDVQDINDSMYWSLGRKILAAAKVVGQHPNLHIIYVTNFKCGPDSFIKHFVQKASGKPFLSLQFDSHANDAGMMTRCEAYLDSKGVLRPWRREQVPVEAG